MSELDSCKSGVCSVGEQEKKAVTTSAITASEQVEISPTGQKIIDFFRLFRNNSEKISVFQDSLLDAKNIGLKQEFDKVLPIIIEEAQNDPNSKLSQNLESMKITSKVQLSDDEIDIAVTRAILGDFSQVLGIPETDNDDVLKSVSSLVKLSMPTEYEKVRKQMKFLDTQKEIEICVLCGGTRITCGGYKSHGPSWPYFKKFQLNSDGTISQK